MFKKILKIILILVVAVAILYVVFMAWMTIDMSRLRDHYEYAYVEIGKVIPGTTLRFVDCEFPMIDGYGRFQPVFEDVITGKRRSFLKLHRYHPLQEDIMLYHISMVGGDGLTATGLYYAYPERPFLVRFWENLLNPSGI